MKKVDAKTVINEIGALFKTAWDCINIPDEELYKTKSTPEQEPSKDIKTEKAAPVQTAPPQPVMTTEQAQQVELNNRALLRNVAEYCCRAFTAIPEYLGLYTNEKAQNLKIRIISGNEFAVKLHSKTSKSHFPVDELETIRESVENAFKNIHYNAVEEISSLNTMLQRERNRITCEYNSPYSCWYGNAYRYQTEMNKVNVYYQRIYNQHSFYLNLPYISGFENVPNGLVIFIHF